jgi:hypothetical protein
MKKQITLAVIVLVFGFQIVAHAMSPEEIQAARDVAAKVAWELYGDVSDIQLVNEMLRSIGVSTSSTDKTPSQLYAALKHCRVSETYEGVLVFKYVQTVNGKFLLGEKKIVGVYLCVDEGFVLMGSPARVRPLRMLGGPLIFVDPFEYWVRPLPAKFSIIDETNESGGGN